MKTLRVAVLMVGAFGLALAASLPARAGMTLFSPPTGDVYVDGLAPSAAPATKTATATAGAATLNRMVGQVTSESLTTAAGATYTLTLTNSYTLASDMVFASVQLGSSTTGMPVVTTVTPSAGQLVIVVQNIHATAALNGTIKISYTTFRN